MGQVDLNVGGVAGHQYSVAFKSNKWRRVCCVVCCVFICCAVLYRTWGSKYCTVTFRSMYCTVLGLVCTVLLPVSMYCAVLYFIGIGVYCTAVCTVLYRMREVGC